MNIRELGNFGDIEIHRFDDNTYQVIQGKSGLWIGTIESVNTFLKGYQCAYSQQNQLLKDSLDFVK